MESISTPLLVVVFLLCSLTNNYLLSLLGSMNVPTGQSLLSRGIVCVLCSIFGGVYLREKIIPVAAKTQVIRFFLAGFGLWAIVESYRHARASEIAIVSRLDIPLMILFGFMLHLRTSRDQKFLAIFLIFSIVGSIWIFSDQRTTTYGLALSLIGTSLLSISYLLLNQTSRMESAAVVSMTPGLSCLVFGAGVLIHTGTKMILDPMVILLTVFSGVAMYSIYRIVRHLYRRLSFLNVQIANVLIPIISIPIDIVGFGSHFNALEYCTFTVISATAVFTCLINESGDKPVEETKNEYHKATA
jgi:hypothetical protein